MQNKVNRKMSSWGAAFLKDVITLSETKILTCSIFYGDRLWGSQSALRFFRKFVVLFKTWIYSWNELCLKFACVSPIYLEMGDDFFLLTDTENINKMTEAFGSCESLCYISILSCSNYSHYSYL